mgnify:CR=1 FL=1
MIKHFQIEVEKCFVSFHCRTINLYKAFTAFTFKYDVREYRNRIKMSSCAISMAEERSGNTIFQWMEISRWEEYNSLILDP